MALKFKKNDRVIYSQKELFESPYYERTGTVVGKDKDHHTMVFVLFDGNDGPSRVVSEHLEYAPDHGTE